MSPPLLLLNAMQINEKALTFNECLRKSRNTTGYHTFTLLFRIEFENLRKPTQLDLLAKHLLPHPGDTSDGRSTSAFVVCERSRKNIRKLANKYWATLSTEKKEAWNNRARIRNNCPHNDGRFSDLPLALSVDQYVSNPIKNHVITSISQEWISFISLLQNAILRRPRKQQNRTSVTSGRSDVEWAVRIYEMVEEGFEKQFLEHYFVPGQNLLRDDKYAQFRETAVSYANMCRRLLTPETAAHFKRAFMGISEVRLSHNE